MNRKLHIGGKQQKEGWEIFNICPGENVDHHGDAQDLSRFADDTFTAIYASHVLEHFDYNGELDQTLREWKRVLLPGGLLYVAVPDLDVLARLLLLKDKLTLEERFFVMRMIFGGHVNEYDYHKVGLNEDFLSNLLAGTGFVDIRRVDKFELFDDTSDKIFKGINISLNMTAAKEQ